MKKQNYFEEFEKLRNKYFEKMKAEYLLRVDNGTNSHYKAVAHNIFQNEVMRKNENELNGKIAQLSNFYHDVKEYVGLNKGTHLGQVFNDRFAAIKVANRDETLRLISEREGLSMMYDFWFQEKIKYEERTSYEYEKEDTEFVEQLEKIEWLGTQKELGELFIELKNKGWLAEIQKELIEKYFTKAETIKQVLKPHTDTKQNKNLYSAIYTKAYRPKFDTIKPNKKREE